MPHSPRVSAEVVGAGPTVWLVEDDASVRPALARLLRSAGMAVRSFASAEEFLAAGSADVTCLVLDVRLPGLSGPELLADLERRGCAPPAVFITAYPEDTCLDCLLAGAVAVLKKPFPEETLLEAIARALRPCPEAPPGEAEIHLRGIRP